MNNPIGGGTYGRIFERGVAYGALFQDSIDTMHQASELRVRRFIPLILVHEAILRIN